MAELKCLPPAVIFLRVATHDQCMCVDMIEKDSAIFRGFLVAIEACTIHLRGTVVMVQGHALHYGRAQLADEYFEMLGYRLPYRVNVADFILDLASGDVSTPDRCPTTPVLFGFAIKTPYSQHPVL